MTRAEGVSTAVSTDATRRSASGPAPPSSPAPRAGMVADALTAATGRDDRAGRWSAPRATSPAQPLAQLGGTGVFVSALRDGPAARRGRPGRALAQGPAHRARRGDRPGRRAAARGPARRRRGPRRAHPGRAPGRLPGSAPVPRAGSPRSRRSGSGVELVGVRGNVDTRLGKVASGELDAVVLARAGLARLGPRRRGHRGARPAPGAARPGPGSPRRGVPRRTPTCSPSSTTTLDDPHTRACVEAERALLAELEAGCSAPVGALAEVAEGDLGDELWIRAVALSPDGAALRTTICLRPARRPRRTRPEARSRDAGRGRSRPDQHEPPTPGTEVARRRL